MRAFQPQLIKFRVHYAAYKKQIEYLNSGRPQSQKIKAASIRHCLQSRLLHIPRILGLTGSIGRSVEATDDAVTAWVCRTCNIYDGEPQ